tara:strand:+ start:209 stop:580 length:372 start_codon:yes stop_codon:yes gene_type:complete
MVAKEIVDDKYVFDVEYSMAIDDGQTFTPRQFSIQVPRSRDEGGAYSLILNLPQHYLVFNIECQGTFVFNGDRHSKPCPSFQTDLYLYDVPASENFIQFNIGSNSYVLGSIILPAYGNTIVDT